MAGLLSQSKSNRDREPQEVDERPAQRRHKPRALMASAPNQLFSWDTTYLPPAKEKTYQK